MGKRLCRTDLSGKYSANIINYCLTRLIQKRFPIKILPSTGAVALAATVDGFHPASQGPQHAGATGCTATRCRSEEIVSVADQQGHAKEFIPRLVAKVI